MNWIRLMAAGAAIYAVVGCAKNDCSALPGSKQGVGVCRLLGEPEAGRAGSPPVGGRIAPAGGRPAPERGGSGGSGGTGGTWGTAPKDAGSADGSEDAGQPSVETCGNGLIDPGEQCDSTTCPTSCETANACLVGRLEGSRDECTAVCKQDRVTTCIDGDGCCADGCDATTDSDCSASCGNDTLETPETCDGDCPTSCDDGEACTVDMQTGTADTCSIVCAHQPATANRTPDGCCPSGANVSLDPDCPQRCGDGVVTGGETCDPQGTRKCPTSCDDGNPCTRDRATGTADACTIACTNEPLAEGDACGNGLRCDASGECTAPTCGDGTVDPGERCDGNCPTSCPQPTGAENECRANVLITRDGPCQVRCEAGVKTAGLLCAEGRGACNGIGGSCVRNVWYLSCSDESNCGGALRCHPVRNVCSRECSVEFEDQQCGNGNSKCVNGWCEQSCEANASGQCKAGQACIESGNDWVCRPARCDPMMSNACPEGGTCKNLPGGDELFRCLP